MNTSTLRIALVIAALVVAAACDESNGLPTAPTSPGAGPTLTVTALTIGGNLSIAAPYGTTQLTATATFSDGTTQDVTAQAQWRTLLSDDCLAVIAPGVARAYRYCKGTVVATYAQAGRSVSGRAEVRVAPDSAFLVVVCVSDGQWPADEARVQVTSGAGTFTQTTDLWGAVELPAVGETLLQVEKAGFRTITRSLTVTSDQTVNVVLER